MTYEILPYLDNEKYLNISEEKINILEKALQ
jgi:hypothetical protein